MYERQHRVCRNADDAYMCDIYDSPRWIRVAGPLSARSDRPNRVVLHLCVDGVNTFAKGRHEQTTTVKPL